MKSKLPPRGGAHAAAELFLTGPQVRRRYGNVSDMWLWRKIHDANGNFPKPIKVSGRTRLWRLSDLLIWELSLASNQNEVA